MTQTASTTRIPRQLETYPATGVPIVAMLHPFATVRPAVPDIEQPAEDAAEPARLPVPTWLVAAHLAFMAWTVFSAHNRPLTSPHVSDRGGWGLFFSGVQ